MARKRSYMAKRMSKMQGIPNEERRLLVRVGELVDSIINNRSAANPSDGPRRFRKDPRLPPPSTVTSSPGIRSVVLEWPPVDSSKLDHYRIEITNQDSGVTETKISFTNRHAFKGRIGGNYRAKISSVGRDGIQSPQFETDEFFISDNVMLLEGAKNSFNVLGTTITEDFFVKQGHKVFAWASFVIDKSIAVDDVNNIATVTLYRTKKSKPLGDESQVLIETITLYKASESATDLDDTALGGITRPNAPKIRSGTFGTEFNVMFSPFTLADDIANEIYEFHLVVGGRAQENDIVNAALSLFSAHEGTGDEIPEDPQEVEPSITLPHLKSIWLDNSQASSFALRAAGSSTGKRCEYLGPGIVENPYRSFGDGSVFTIAYWAKDGHNSGTAADPEINWFKDNNQGSLPGGSNFRAGGYHLFMGNAGRDNGWTSAPNRNEVQINMNWTLSSGNPTRVYRVDLSDKDGNGGAWVALDPTFPAGLGGRPGNDGPWGPNRITPIDTTTAAFVGTNGPGEWQFYTIFFDTVNGIDVYIDGVKRSPFTNTTDSGLVFDSTNRLEYLFGPEEAYRTISSGGTTYITWRGMMDPNNPPPIAASGSGIHPDDGTNLSWDYSATNAADVTLWQAAVWDFSPGPMFGNAGMLAMHRYLWNLNDGWEIDWRENGGTVQASGLPAYFFSDAMRHQWLFGNVNATQYMARDTGFTSTGTGTAATENGRADASLVNEDDDEATNPGFDEPGGISSGVGRAEALVNGFSGFSTRDLRYICTASDNRTIVGDSPANVVPSKSNIVDDYPDADELWAYPKTGDR